MSEQAKQEQATFQLARIYADRKNNAWPSNNPYKWKFNTAATHINNLVAERKTTLRARISEKLRPTYY